MRASQAFGLSALSFPSLLVIGFFWGCRSRNFKLGNFAGSRPLSDRQIAGTVLKSATLGLIASAAICFAFWILNFLIFSFRWQSNPTVRLDFRLSEFLGVVTLFSLAAWSCVGLITSLALAGRKAITTALGLLFGYVTITMSLSRFASDGAAKTFSIAVLILCAAGCGAAFLAAWRRRLMTLSALGLSALIALLALGAACMAWRPSRPRRTWCMRLPGAR